MLNPDSDTKLAIFWCCWKTLIDDCLFVQQIYLHVGDKCVCLGHWGAQNQVDVILPILLYTAYTHTQGDVTKNNEIFTPGFSFGFKPWGTPCHFHIYLKLDWHDSKFIPQKRVVCMQPMLHVPQGLFKQ